MLILKSAPLNLFVLFISFIIDLILNVKILNQIVAIFKYLILHQYDFNAQYALNKLNMLKLIKIRHQINGAN